MTAEPDAPVCGQVQGAWLLLAPDAVPARWAERAVACSLLSLLPREAGMLLSGSAAVPELDPTDLRVAQLTTSGATTAEMARTLGVSDRTVQRRLSRLRRRLGADSKASLALELARRGF